MKPEEEIARSVVLMRQMFNLPAPAAVIEFWVLELRKDFDEHTRRALSWACKQSAPPGIDQVLRIAGAERRAAEERIERAAFVPAEKAEADAFFAEMRKRLGYES